MIYDILGCKTNNSLITLELLYLIISLTRAEISSGSLICLKWALSAPQVEHARPCIVFRSEMAVSHPTVSLRHSHSAGHIARQIITITCQSYSLAAFSSHAMPGHKSTAALSASSFGEVGQMSCHLN